MKSVPPCNLEFILERHWHLKIPKEYTLSNSGQNKTGQVTSWYDDTPRMALTFSKQGKEFYISLNPIFIISRFEIRSCEFESQLYF